MVTTLKNNRTICEIELESNLIPKTDIAALHFWCYNSDYWSLSRKRSDSFDLSLRFKSKQSTWVYNFFKN